MYHPGNQGLSTIKKDFMKKIFSLITIALLAFIPLQNIKAEKKSGQFLNFNVNVYNDTPNNGSISVSGPSSVGGTIYPGHNNFGPVTAGTYTVYMYSTYGPHTFIFNGIHQTTNNGQAVFYNVSINGNSYAYVV
jgi:hypothetical protein